MNGWYVVRTGQMHSVTGECKGTIGEAMADANAKDTDNCTPYSYNSFRCQLATATVETSTSSGLWIAYAVAERGSKLSVFDSVRSSATAAAVAVTEEIASRNEDIREESDRWTILFMRIQRAGD